MIAPIEQLPMTIRAKYTLSISPMNCGHFFKVLFSDSSGKIILFMSGTKNQASQRNAVNNIEDFEIS